MDNPIFSGLGGIKIIESDLLVIGPFEDWSQVRSHGRAARRRKQGHHQRIRLYYKPDPNAKRMGDTLIMHPATAQDLRRALEQKALANV
jgi:hypothetical protein